MDKALGVQAKQKLVEELIRQKLNMKKGEFPASKGQEGLFLQYKLSPETTAYNVNFEAIINGHVDIDILRESFLVLLDKHRILRTFYSEANSGLTKVTQNVHDDHRLDWNEYNVQDKTEHEIDEMISKCSMQPFNLEKGPVMRINIFNREERNDSIMLLSMHHIAVDYWSFGLLLRELGEIYTSLLKGDKLDFLNENNSAEYTEFAKEQVLLLKSLEGEKMLEYWKENFKGELPYINFPIDYERPEKNIQDGSSCNFSLNREITKKLKMLAASTNTTPYMVLLTVNFILLRRYTNQDDIIIGSPIAGRDDAKYKNTIGYFVNMLPLRANLKDNPYFLELLEQVKETVIKGIDNGKIPFYTIVNELNVQRQKNRSPIFQVSLTLEKSTSEIRDKNLNISGDGEISLNALTLKPVRKPVTSSQYEFSMYLEEVNGEYKGQIHYQTSLFKLETIQRFIQHYINLFDEILENPEERIGNYSFLTCKEKEQILSIWNNTGAKYSVDKCLHTMIEEQAIRYPANIAITCSGKSLTYQELDTRAKILASHLRGKGVSAEVKVPILMQPNLDMIVAMLAVLKAGGVYVPLNPIYPDNRISEILEDIEAPIIITENGLKSRVESLLLQKIYLDIDWNSIEKEEYESFSSDVSPNNTAYIIYTSGSTGKPKGVMVRHYNVIRLFRATEHWYNFGENDIWTMFHSFSFDFSVWEIFGALLYGGKLVVVPYYITREPEEFYKLLSNEKVTVLNQTPSAFKQLMKVDEKLHEKYLLSLKHIIFGGEALNLKSLKPWFDSHGDEYPKLVNMYGITETTVHVTYRRVTKEDTENDSGSLIGAPIPDLQVYLLDENKKFVPIGVSGEIFVGGDGVAKGYFNRRELTEAKFMDDFINYIPGNRLYRSGDLGRYLPNGDIEYLGRIDSQIKIRGFRIELGDIQSKILDYKDVKDAVVFVDDTDKEDKKIVAYVIMSDGSKLNEIEIRQQLKTKLPEYMVPSAFIVIDEIPLNSNGKIDRSKLPKVTSQSNDLEGYVAPEKDMQKKLADIWCDVLKLDKVGIEHNFFDLGGNSILLMEANTKIKESIDPDLAIADMFQYSTIKSLAEFIESKSSEKSIDKNTIDRTDRVQLRRNAMSRRV